MAEETPEPKPDAVAVCRIRNSGNTTATPARASLPSHDTNTASAVRKVMRAAASPMLGAASDSSSGKTGASRMRWVRLDRTDMTPR
jgi:hypothetical protein